MTAALALSARTTSIVSSSSTGFNKEASSSMKDGLELASGCLHNGKGE